MRTAGMKLPEELSASFGVGATRFAMMGDRSLGKAQEEVSGIESISSSEFEAGAGDFLFRAAHGFAVGRGVAKRGVADAR